MVWGWGITSLTLAIVPTTVSIKMYPSNSIIMAYLVNQSDSEQRKTPNNYEGGFELVPRARLELAHSEEYWILNRVSFRLYSPHDTLLTSERVTHPELPTSLLLAPCRGDEELALSGLGSPCNLGVLSTKFK